MSRFWKADDERATQKTKPAGKGEVVDIEAAIKNPEWWRQAAAMPDRHRGPAAGVSVADHLEAVSRNLRLLRPFPGRHPYFGELQRALERTGLDPASTGELLAPVALLHDIGKPREDKDVEGKHPLTGKPVEMRHPVLGVMAAMELLPHSLAGRDTILALIEKHDQPYSWYRQFQKFQRIPKHASWARLDRKIDLRGNGTGLALLAIFKLADIDGHTDLADVSWFMEQANDNYLREKGKWLPIPCQAALESLRNKQAAPVSLEVATLCATANKGSHEANA